MTVTAGEVTPELVQEFLAPYAEAWELYKTQRQAGNAWPWVQQCMRTRDEDAGAAGLPSEHLSVPDKPHLRVYTWAWYAVKLLQVDKSRQLMITWMTCGLNVHEAMFTPSAKVGYQHITGTDTAEKMDKYMLYILEAQPYDLMLPWVEERDHPPKEWVEQVTAWFGLSLKPPSVPRADQPPYFGSEGYILAKQLSNPYRKSSSAEGVVEITLKPFFETDERTIEAIPAGHAGPNKWRGSTRTRAGHDEAWFHLRLAANVNSAAKSIGQNGRQVLVSTASRGEDGDDYPLEMIKRHPKQPEYFGGYHGSSTLKVTDLPPGVEMWLTQFGYTHLRIWYHADPEKRGETWYRNNVLTGDRRENNREILIQYDASTGNPFYEVFDDQLQRIQERLPSERSRYVVGADGGRRPAAVLLEVLPSGRVIAVAECVTPRDRSSNVSVLADRMHSEWGTRFPGWHKEATIALDPSMFDTRSETSEETASEVFLKRGWYVVKGSMDLESRYRAVQKLCLESVIDEYSERPRPKLLIDAARCPDLYAGMAGACTVPKQSEASGTYVKDKGHASHVVDALEYAATYINATPFEDEEVYDMQADYLHRARR